MGNLIFEEGLKSYTINNDPDRVIKVSTTDPSILVRWKNAEKEMKEKVESLNVAINADGTPTEEAVAERVEELTLFINKEIDYIFNASVSDVVFNGQSPLATCKGVPLFERFIDAIMPVIAKDIEKENEASDKRLGEYTINSKANAYKKNVKGSER